MSGSTKTIAKLLIALIVTAVGGFFAVVNATYGGLGLYSALNQHEVWSAAGMVYGSLLLVSMLCAAVVIATWLLFFRQAKG